MSNVMDSGMDMKVPCDYKNELHVVKKERKNELKVRKDELTDSGLALRMLAKAIPGRKIKKRDFEYFVKELDILMDNIKNEIKKAQYKINSLKGEAFGIPDRNVYSETQKLLAKNNLKLKKMLDKL
jgi:hypothetical protein